MSSRNEKYVELQNHLRDELFEMMSPGELRMIGMYLYSKGISNIIETANKKEGVSNLDINGAFSGLYALYLSGFKPDAARPLLPAPGVHTPGLKKISWIDQISNTFMNIGNKNWTSAIGSFHVLLYILFDDPMALIPESDDEH